MAQSPSQADDGRAHGLPHNPRLRDLVQAKRRGHFKANREDLQRGFGGWRERGYLPHFDAPHVTQFVTFMLENSFPVERRADWEPLWGEQDQSAKRRKIEAWLDRGHGPCWLRRRDVAEVIERELQADNGKLFRLQAWVIMPNHVHLVVDVWETPLSKLVNLWKGRSSHAANWLLKRRGRLWAREYFDTYIRDATHRDKAIRYTENNPAKAKFVRDPKQWAWGSARFRDEYGRLT